MGEFTGIAAFRPHYLREHSRPGTRALHYAGTSLVVLIAIGALTTRLPVAARRLAWLKRAGVVAEPSGRNRA